MSKHLPWETPRASRKERKAEQKQKKQQRERELKEQKRQKGRSPASSRRRIRTFTSTDPFWNEADGKYLLGLVTRSEQGVTTVTVYGFFSKNQSLPIQFIEHPRILNLFGQRMPAGSVVSFRLLRKNIKWANPTRRGYLIVVGTEEDLLGRKVSSPAIIDDGVEVLALTPEGALLGPLKCRAAKKKQRLEFCSNSLRPYHDPTTGEFCRLDDIKCFVMRKDRPHAIDSESPRQAPPNSKALGSASLQDLATWTKHLASLKRRGMSHLASQMGSDVLTLEEVQRYLRTGSLTPGKADGSVKNLPVADADDQKQRLKADVGNKPTEKTAHAQKEAKERDSSIERLKGLQKTAKDKETELAHAEQVLEDRRSQVQGLYEQIAVLERQLADARKSILDTDYPDKETPSHDPSELEYVKSDLLPILRESIPSIKLGQAIALHALASASPISFVPSLDLIELYCISYSPRAEVKSIEPSPHWLSFQDAWRDSLEALWKFSTENPDRFVLGCLPLLNRSLVDYWARPLWLLAEDLVTEINDGIVWPRNLRLFATVDFTERGEPLSSQLIESTFALSHFNVPERDGDKPEVKVKGSIDPQNLWPEKCTGSKKQRSRNLRNVFCRIFGPSEEDRVNRMTEVVCTEWPKQYRSPRS